MQQLGSGRDGAAEHAGRRPGVGRTCLQSAEVAGDEVAALHVRLQLQVGSLPRNLQHRPAPTSIAVQTRLGSLRPLSGKLRAAVAAWISLLCRRPHFRKRSQWKVGDGAKIEVTGNFLASTSSGDPYLFLWKKIWNARVPGRVKFCVWRAVKNILPIREHLSHKGYTSPGNYLLCQEVCETNTHVFRHCLVAKEALRIAAMPLQSSMPCHFKDWMLTQGKHFDNGNWERLIMLVWALWKNRNKKLWNDTTQTTQAIVVGSLTWYQKFLQVQQMQIQSQSAKPSKYWTPPPTQKLKINVDRAFLPSKHIGGIGGFIRRDDGSFVAGFSQSFQYVSSPKQVKLLAIRTGIDLLLQLRLGNIYVESDCQLAIQEVGANDFELNENTNLLADIHHGSKLVKDLSFLFAPRTANIVAHRLISCFWL
ncbi:uncharacterized protein LOC112177831 [Rosa chinensis]|uniref:uncharacterized protein LOC112177831 n=1 Tax=Rosa chinensis TaxID=74649 RepID=UPI000D09200A|nr:uncharacterized protein LOC112177831 [Rosa chinensis]